MGSLRMTVRPPTKTRVMRERSPSCTSTPDAGCGGEPLHSIDPPHRTGRPGDPRTLKGLGGSAWATTGASAQTRHQPDPAHRQADGAPSSDAVFTARSAARQDVI